MSTRVDNKEKERFAVLRTLRVRPSIIVIILCVLTLETLPGEMRRGTLTGTVTDGSGRPLKGASVQLQNVATLRIASSITDEAGKYRFYGLRSDIDYKLKAHYHGKWSAEEYLSRFDANREATKNLEIK
jgi:hypothetical protein